MGTRSIGTVNTSDGKHHGARSVLEVMSMCSVTKTQSGYSLLTRLGALLHRLVSLCSFDWNGSRDPKKRRLLTIVYRA